MWFKIQEKLTKKERKERPELFIEKDFENEEAAEEYAKEFCGSWKNIKIKEV